MLKWREILLGSSGGDTQEILINCRFHSLPFGNTGIKIVLIS